MYPCSGAVFQEGATYSSPIAGIEFSGFCRSFMGSPSREEQVDQTTLDMALVLGCAHVTGCQPGDLTTNATCRVVLDLVKDEEGH